MRPLLKVMLAPSNGRGELVKRARTLLFKVDRLISQIQVLPLLGTQYGIVSDTQRETSKWQPSLLADVFNALLYKYYVFSLILTWKDRNKLEKEWWAQR